MIFSPHERKAKHMKISSSVNNRIVNTVFAGAEANSSCAGDTSACSNSPMPGSIEQYLFSFSGIAPFSFLCSSWIVEKNDFQKRLSTIPLTFTTYTSHGADHSEAILSRIEALLGEQRIRQLSPTDAWLLLQCAYSHDLGMCVSESEKDQLFQGIVESPEKLERLLNDVNFRSFLNDIEASSISNPVHLHNRFLTCVRFINQMIDRGDPDEIKKCLAKITHGEYTSTKRIFSIVLERYFRKYHAERTRNILIREAQTGTLHNTIPVRLRKIIAEIDYCHGISWQEMMKRLPQQDNGLHTDYIHPRFIAGLLRLGDLLDLDSNRFNPYQIDSAGKLPRESAIHLLKHMAITEFMVDTNWIDITARYQTDEAEDFLWKHYFQSPKEQTEASERNHSADETVRLETGRIIEESANALREWFTWLQDDLREFSHHWNAMVPAHMSGYIAALRKNDIYIGDSDTPVESDELELRYSISPRRASQIIEGAELYNDSLVFIRELVQNSIDATKRQVFQSLSSYPDGLMSESTVAFSPLWISTLNRFKVQVEFAYIQGKAQAQGKTEDVLRITFRDYGIGITYEKLKQMRRIGSISLSEEERKELREMPECLKPTGEYGIGMQSVFTITDHFKIETYPRYEKNRKMDHKRVIDLYCPELGGDIVNAEEQKQEKERYGTDVIVCIPLERDTVRKLMLHNEISTYDILSDRVLDIDTMFGRFMQYISKTFTNDLIETEFSFNRQIAGNTGHKESVSCINFGSLCNRHLFTPLNGEETLLKLEDKDGFSLCYWYDKPEKPESVLLRLKNRAESQVRLYYKGIAISNRTEYFDPERIFRIPGVDLQINILSGNAGNLLEINRDYVKPAAYKQLRELVQHSLISFYIAVYSYLAQKIKNEIAAGKDGRSPEENDLIFRFLLENPQHIICFYQVLNVFKDQMGIGDVDSFWSSFGEKMNRELFKMNTSAAYVNPSNVPIISILYGDGYFGSLTAGEALRWLKNGSVWFTDYRFTDSFRASIHFSDTQEALCAIYDDLSGIYDLTYGRVRIIREEAWKTKYIRLYTLVAAEPASQYPDFDLAEYHLMCKLIVNDYLDRYQSEKDPDKKEQIGSYYLSFPAIKEYPQISVPKFPAESPDELACRYSRFIVCPCNVEMLSEYFEKEQGKRLAALKEEKMRELLETEAVSGFVRKLLSVGDNADISPQINGYKDFFSFFSESVGSR